MPTKKEKTNRSIELSPEDGGSNTLSPAKGWFLGIGIDDYVEFPKLNNAVKDVEDVMKVLVNKYDLDKENAFLLTNEEATEDNIIERLDFFSKKLNKDDKLMIYYSGHGHLDRNTNLGFWIPQDAIQGKTSRYIRNSTIRDYLNVINTRHTLLISDSCFSGSLFVRGASRAANSAIEELEALESRWAICSGRADEEVNDGPPGGNSPFAESILDTLNRNQDKFLNIAKIADKVILQTRSNYEQLPEGNPLYGVGHKGGQYIFRLKANEKEAWATCQTEGTLAAYQTFLVNYPDGKHAEDAKEELTFLKEEKAWATAKAKNTITAYTEYDQQFPKGRYSRQSLEAIKDLEDDQHWEKALRRNTITGYKEYLLGHPTGLHLKEAKANLEAILQGKPEAKNIEAVIEKAATIISKEEPIITKSAEEEAWEGANKLNTKEAYDQFHLRFPHGKFRNEVREALKRFEQPKQIKQQSTAVPKSVNKGRSNSDQTKKIAIGATIAVVIAGLIFVLASLFGGGKEVVNPEVSKLSIQEIENLIIKNGYEIENLKLALNETQLSIFGMVKSDPIKNDIDHFLHDLEGMPVSNINNKLGIISQQAPELSLDDIKALIIQEGFEIEDLKLALNKTQLSIFGKVKEERIKNDVDYFVHDLDGIPVPDINNKISVTSNKPVEKTDPPKIDITEKTDRLLVKISEGKPPYSMSLLKGNEERYTKAIDIAGVYTIKLKEHQKDPGLYTVLVEDKDGVEAKMNIDIIGSVKVDNSSRALYFDGKDDYITFKNPKHIPTGNSPYTIEAWVYANKMGMLGIVGWGPYGKSNQVNALRLGSGAISHYWWNNDLVVKTGDISKNWYHIAASFDGKTRIIYLNGIEIGQDKPTNHNVPNADNLTIGKTFRNEYFNGMIDEVRIWDKARNTSEIQENMLRKLSGRENGLVAYYNFDQGEANGNNSSVKELNDISGHSNTGTLNGFSLSGKSSNWTKGIELISTNASLTLDQSQKTSSGTFGSPDRWQSFTAGRTGYLTKIGASHYHTKQVGNLYIYEGEGKNGKLLHSQPTVADGTKMHYFNLTKAVRLEKGKKYTIRFDKFAWFVGKGNAYSGGRADFNAGLDFFFETYVIPIKN